jgi:Family of unknown function (DUF6352)
MRDFWKSSGFHLLDRDAEGKLGLTNAFLTAYLNRPELAPVEESCAAEIALHDALLRDPRQAIGEDRIAALEDPDARDNYRVMIAFRDHLVAGGTLEACYLSLSRNGFAGVPPLFTDHMVHAIMRNMLDGCDDPIRLRAAELLFRAQNVRLLDGAIMLADREVVEMHAATGGFGTIGKLFAETGTPTKTVELDVLSAENAELYWARDDDFDTVLDVSFGRPGLIGLCGVLEIWLRHFFGVEVQIEPVGMIRDERWLWHVGLDADASAILNDLYNGVEVEEDRLRRILSLFRLTFRDPSQMRADIAGRPVYLGMAMDGSDVLRLKPQNLLANLPLAESN